MKSGLFLMAMLGLITGCNTNAHPPVIDNHEAPPVGYNQPHAIFAPPSDIRIERTWKMTSEGYDVGEMHSLRSVGTYRGTRLIKDERRSNLGFRKLNDTQASEVVWLGPRGLEAYNGTFYNDGRVTTISAQLEGTTLNYELIEDEGDQPYRQKWTENKDYHWTTLYMGIPQTTTHYLGSVTRVVLSLEWVAEDAKVAAARERHFPIKEI